MTDVVIAPRVESVTSDVEAVVADAFFRVRPSSAYSSGGQWVLPVWPSATTPLNGAAVTVKLDALPTVPYELELTFPDGEGGSLLIHEFRIVPSSGSPVAWDTCTLVTGPLGGVVPTGTVQAAIDALWAAVGGVTGGASTVGGISNMSTDAKTLVITPNSYATMRGLLGAADDTLVAHLAGTETVTGAKTVNTLSAGAFTATTSATVPTPTTNSHAATKLYVDSTVGSGTIVDASTSVKGKVQLAGDLAGTAAAPTVPGLATLTSSLATTNTTATTLAATVATLSATVTALKAGWVINRAVSGVYPARPVTAAGQSVLWVGPTQPTVGGTVSSATGAVPGLDFYGILA